jgi:hypothetical protein
VRKVKIQPKSKDEEVKGKKKRKPYVRKVKIQPKSKDENKKCVEEDEGEGSNRSKRVDVVEKSKAKTSHQLKNNHNEAEEDEVQIGKRIVKSRKAASKEKLTSLDELPIDVDEMPVKATRASGAPVLGLLPFPVRKKKQVRL